MDTEHPVLLELASLRQTAAKFQHEAHTAAIKLQRHALDASRLHEYAAALEQENARLTHELGVLRENPDVTPHPAIAQVQELSLALRRISDKIALTEEKLLERTAELTDTRSELAGARYAVDGAYELAARMRAREEAAKARERELEFKARASEEERKMVDLVVQEYADLVRNLEGRKSANTPAIPNGSTSSVTLVDNLQDGKSNLHRMLTAFSTESEQHHATIAELNTKISDLQMTMDTERTAAAHDRASLAQAKTELDKLNLEDQTAAKMVARYMKFSQASINALQQQITTLRTRHASTIVTVELQASIAETQLASERTRTARLQEALDELCEDLARESYGRRREVSLRLALLSREETVAEFMRRWARRARESYARCYNPTAPEDAVQEAFHRVVSDAESLLSALDDDVQCSDVTRTSGALARITLAREAVEALRSELQDEVQKRVEAVQRSVFDDLDETASGIQDFVLEGVGPHHLESNGDARPEQASPPLDVDSPLSAAGGEQSMDDPFVVTISTVEETKPTILQEEVHSSRKLTPDTLLVDEEPTSVRPRSPAVSTLDLGQDLEELATTDPVQIHRLPDETSVSPPPDANGNAPVLAEGETSIPCQLTSTTIPAVENVQDDALIPSPSATIPTTSVPSPTNPHSTLLAELENTKHRYDTLQRAFRDCSLALKDLKRTLGSASSPHTKQRLQQHLEAALARIDDYAEDARVELEIRIADEELTMRGFETVLSVPGALADAAERAEVEVSVRAFMHGTDEGVVRALERFGRKLEDVQHDVAVVKRAVHGLAMPEDGEAHGEGEGEGGDDSAGAGASTGATWTAWTAGLLGAATPTRAPTPVQTFGTVMTSPRLRHAASLKQLQAQGPGSDEGLGEGEDLLAGLGLRIAVPMPIPSSSPARLSLSYPYGRLGVGLGRAEGPTRPRTLSAMYAMGGLRSSSVSVGLGVGLGSPSPVRTQTRGGVSGGAGQMEGSAVQDLGGVE